MLRLDGLRQFLTAGRNGDGGWAYHRGKASRLEPTCWALLGLRMTGDAGVLEQWPASDGLLLERLGGGPNYAYHAVALLAIRALRARHTAGHATLLDGLQRAKGMAMPQSPINRQDNSLVGWSWIEGTFSWVEPTAWGLLALKLWRQAGAPIDAERIETAERLLLDRCVRTGGWNYGNSNMLGQELKAFVPTTALALLAMQDRAEVPEVARSLSFLDRHATDERAGVSMALALLALRAYGRPTERVEEALLDQVPQTLEFGNQMAVALTLYALAEGPHDAVLL